MGNNLYALIALGYDFDECHPLYKLLTEEQEMGLFNGYEQEIAARQKALQEYKEMMISVANDADKVISLIPSIIESLSSYENERKQFVDAVISALGVESTSVSTSEYGSTKSAIANESYPTLTVKTSQLALGDDGNVYIGFDRRKARNGGNAAPLWLKHLTSSYKGVTGTIRDNWFQSGLTDKYLLVISGIDDDLLTDIVELNFTLTPDEAIEAQRYGMGETPLVEVVTEIENESLADIYA